MDGRDSKLRSLRETYEERRPGYEKAVGSGVRS